MTGHAVSLHRPAAVPAPAAPPAVDFAGMMAMADTLVASRFLPEHIKTPAQAVAIILTGQELGMPPMRAIRSLSIVKGKVVEAADSQLARFKADGGRAQFRTLDDAQAVLWLRHPNGDEHVEEFGIEDARRAGLLSNNQWRSYPRAMLRSRAITAGLKSIGWEGAVGNYDPDEARAFTPAATVTAPVPADEPIGNPIPGYDNNGRATAERDAELYDLLDGEPDDEIRRKIGRRLQRGMSVTESDEAIKFLVKRAVARGDFGSRTAPAEVDPDSPAYTDPDPVPVHLDPAADAVYGQAAPITPAERGGAFDRNDPFVSPADVATQVGLALEEKKARRGRPAIAEP